MSHAFLMQNLRAIVIGAFLSALSILSFIFLIAYDTLVYDSPFQSNNTRANIRIDTSGTVIFQYWCEMTATRPAHARASRFIAHTPSGKTIDFGTSERIYKAGTTPVYREFPLGPKEMVEKGEWCFSATMFYHPTFSIGDHHYQTPRTCANVQ